MGKKTTKKRNSKNVLTGEMRHAGEPVPDAGREADSGEQDGADDDAGLQLVQEPEAEGQDAVLSGCRTGRVRPIEPTTAISLHRLKEVCDFLWDFW